MSELAVAHTLMRASSRMLSHWYPRLAGALEAGLSLERCIATMSGPSDMMRAQLSARLAAGDPIDVALETGARWLPAVDRQLIIAGALSGRLPDALRRLAARHQESKRAQIGIALATAYPIAVAHFGALAFPVELLVNGGGPVAYAAAVLKVLVPFWVTAGSFLLAVHWRLRPALALLDALPFVGGFRRARALADLAFVLEAQIVAGARVDVAWLQAGIASGDRRLEPVAIAVAEAVQRGEPAGLALPGRSEIPSLFAEFYRNGEITGKLDDSLQVLQRSFRETAATKLKIAGMLYPSLLFIAVAGWVAVKIVLFYAGYFDRINHMMD